MISLNSDIKLSKLPLTLIFSLNALFIFARFNALNIHFFYNLIFAT